LENDLVKLAERSPGSRRAKYVLNGVDMHTLLGLPENVRVVSMYTNPDPDLVCVIIEGSGVEPHGGMFDPTHLAWQGLVEAPPVAWQAVDR
jgi:hypothetical protein